MTLHLLLNTNRPIPKEGTVSTIIAIPSILLAFLTGMLLVGTAFSESGLAKGKFLVASRRLADSNFSETAILLIEYNQEGALGVVINRPTEVRLSTLLPEIKGLQQRTDPVYLGGPVARSQMLLLVRSSSEPEEFHRICEDIYLCSSRTVLQRMIDKAGTGVKFRAYVGYAGWAPGQLDREVSRGDWHVLPADAATVFDKTASDIWPELIHRSEVQWAQEQQPDQGNFPLTKWEDTAMKQRPVEEYVHVSAVDWQSFPGEFSTGGIRWKLLHVSPEVGAWTAIFDCPQGSSFAGHIHVGPGEYFLTKGKMEVRGGQEKGGATAYAVGYGYEACNARHDRTYFPEDSEFYMTFLGPLQFIDGEGNTLAVVGWEQAQALWAQQTGRP